MFTPRAWAQRVPRLLCLGCNTGLGNFKDDPALLRRAADYLETDGFVDEPWVRSPSLAAVDACESDFGRLRNIRPLYMLGTAVRRVR
jgi:hypothetical protein